MPAARPFEFAIRLAVLGGLVAWAFFLVRPFVTVVTWGAVMAVSLYPAYARVLRSLGDRPKLAAVFTVFALAAVLAVPILLLTESLATGLGKAIEAYDAGRLRVPAPPEGIEHWPVLGEGLANVWTLAHRDLAMAMQRYAPELLQLRSSVMSGVKGAGFALLQLAVSTVLMGVFLATAPGAAKGVRLIVERLAGEEGNALVSLARDTIRSVARGIVGTALIQALLGGLGCAVAGVPAAGLWAFLVLLLAVAQLPPVLALVLPVIYFAQTGSTWAVALFALWSLMVGSLDNVLKPILLGRGVDAPMLVVFLGAIGGLLLSGLLGLFVGPVVLAVGYTLAREWVLATGDAVPATEPTSAPTEQPQ